MKEIDKSLELAKQCNIYADISVNNRNKKYDKLVKEVLSLNTNSTIQVAKEVEK